MSTETVLTDEQINEIDPDGLREGFARAIEQAVLQSPEIQALRKDAKRYQLLRSANKETEGIVEDMHEACLSGDDLDAALDEAMEKQT